MLRGAVEFDQQARRNQNMPKRKAPEPTQPNVGIFFLLGNKLLIDRTPISEGEVYGDFSIHERGHDTFWEMLRHSGAVPQNSEYDDYPRGRVAYNTKTGKYSLFLDRCILKNKSIVNKIISDLSLPIKSTEVDTDSHYRCPNCIGRDTDRVLLTSEKLIVPQKCLEPSVICLKVNFAII
jgi:hypothetical protein